MKSHDETPDTLQEIIRYFSDVERAFEYMTTLRWPDGVTCPHCHRKDHTFIRTRKIWRCKGCRKQFSLKKGTIMEASPLGYDKWVITFWLLANCKNGISSYELARHIGVCQKSAWFLLQRAREVMITKDFEPRRKFSGITEADEFYHGGEAKNMHKWKREQKIKGRGGSGKVIVLGVMKRGGEVRVTVAPDTKRETVQGFIKQNVRKGSKVFTDTMGGYSGLGASYTHETVAHSAHEYVRGEVHCNSMENFWSLVARIFSGTYIYCAAGHLPRYLSEQVYRFNNRKVTDAVRFERVISRIAGQRLTFQQLLFENRKPKVEDGKEGREATGNTGRVEAV